MTETTDLTLERHMRSQPFAGEGAPHFRERYGVVYDIYIQDNDRGNTELSMWLETDEGRIIVDINRKQLEKILNVPTDVPEPVHDSTDGRITVDQMNMLQAPHWEAKEDGLTDGA